MAGTRKPARSEDALGSLYFREHHELQTAFGTEKLANFLDEHHVHGSLTDEDKAFIAGRDMFFLSSVDPDGNPTVSYKGGAPGFVRIIGDRQLAFPGYDGNGMFLSMGNIAGQGRVGLLFIDFETPNRLRLQGMARIVRQDPLIDAFPEAQYLVFVDVAKAWVNCPRYIHTYRKVAQSKYVPEPSKTTPMAGWKKLDMVQDVLPEHEQARAREEGVLDLGAYADKLAKGDA